jgi:uncharacterized protein (TIGR02647 family)
MVGDEPPVVSKASPILQHYLSQYSRMDRLPILTKDSPMPYSLEIIEELSLLARFNLDSTQEGLKIHSTAEPEVVAASQRLFDKGLISQADGGYLTNLGLSAAEYAQKLLQILN